MINDLYFYNATMLVNKKPQILEGTIDYITAKYVKARKDGASVRIVRVRCMNDDTAVLAQKIEKLVIKKAKVLGSIPEKFVSPGVRRYKRVDSQLANGTIGFRV